jgi:SPP1 gp7 family putative phage head morphogenesis protein
MQLQEWYGGECCPHEHEMVKLADPGDDETESLLNGFLKRIYDGTLDKGDIDPDYYKFVADSLQSGVAKGLGGTQFGADDYRNILKAYLDQNIYAFSSARSLYMLEQYRNFLTDADGNLLSESAFINKVSQISEVDNITYLKTERASAIASAQMAEKWQGLQAFPALEYRTAEDDRVRPEHAVLDNLVLATDDPRWGSIYPPNGWNCRCTVIPAAGDAQLSPDDHATDVVKAADIQPYFKRNVGEQQLVFADDHPYIQKVGAGKLKELDAVKNYGLRSGEKIYNGVTDLPSYKALTDKATANAWWEDMAGSQRGSFELESLDNLAVTFDNDFRNHLLEKAGEDRFKFIKEVKTLLEDPDEVWSNRVKDKVTNLYIKYFKDVPMVLVVDAENTVRAVTLYEVQKGGKINYKALQNMRKGILKYKSR